MPTDDRVDPTMLDAMAVRLDRSGAEALNASREVLAHYPDTGDASTQRPLNDLLVHAADALQALARSLADGSQEIRSAAQRASSMEPGTSAARASRGHDNLG